MAHHCQEVGKGLSNVDLMQVNLNVDERRRAINYLIVKIQQEIINSILQEDVQNQMQQVLQVPIFGP